MKYEGHFDFVKFPFFSFKFDKSIAPGRWPELLALADKLAARLKTRFGIVHIFRASASPWVTEEDRLRTWMRFSAQPVPVEFRPNGPLGLGVRTYFGGDILGMFGRDLLLSTPGVTTELDWGGIRIDLAQDLWNADPAAVMDQWMSAMKHLEPAQAFASPVFLESRLVVDFTPSPAWTKLPKKLNGQ